MSYVNYSWTTAFPVYTYTAGMNVSTTYEPVRQIKRKLTVGVALSITGNILISAALNIQKYSHNRLLDSGQSYLKSPTWWCGMFMMAVGEIGNFAAYGFAPASLVAPLGTTAVISNVIIASLFLKEKFGWRNAVGITLAIIGACLLVSFSNRNEAMVTAHEVVANIKTYTFIAYILVETAVFLIILFLHHQRKYKRVVTILLQVALLGSVTVISAKAVSSMISISFGGDNQLVHPIFYIMFVIMVISAVGQIKFLNQAMASFDATVVMPINFVFFTLSAILSGIAFYQEFAGLTSLQVAMFILGAVLSFCGVYFITRGRASPSKDDNECRSLLHSRQSFSHIDLLTFPHDIAWIPCPPPDTEQEIMDNNLAEST